jgi:hypothetical protein
VEMTEINNQFIRASLKHGLYFFGERLSSHCYLLELFNITDAPLKIKVPLTERIKISGEKIPQKRWGGSVNGVKGIVLDPGVFCSMHLVYLNEYPEADETISVVVDLLNIKSRLNFKFQPLGTKDKNYKKEYCLINCQLQDVGENKKSQQNTDEWEALLNRVDCLESTLLKTLSRIEILEKKESVPRLATLNTEQLTQESFDDVMDWLLDKKSVALEQLRARLLPLNLLVGSVMADLNEKALDQMGDLALEDDGKVVVVNRLILQKVLGKA